MRYSVWNRATKAFDYYDTSEVAPTHTPPRRVSVGGLGATPDQAAWPLPASAKKVGSGATAQGRIAAIGGGVALGDLGTARPWVIIGGLAAAAVLAKRYLR